MKVVKGNLSAKGMSFALVASRFNEFISSKLVDGAVDALLRHGADESDVHLYWVPGSFEIPPLAKKLAMAGKFDAVICLGAIIKGDTPHFNYIANEAAKGVALAGMSTDTPCIFGIITSDTLEQAIERAGTKSGNKGADAAMSAMEMADIYRKVK